MEKSTYFKIMNHPLYNKEFKQKLNVKKHSRAEIRLIDRVRTDEGRHGVAQRINRGNMWILCNIHVESPR